MKKLLFLCGAALIAASCTNAPAPTTVSGELEGLDAEDSLLVYIGHQSDTIPAPNGVFSYEYTDSVAGIVSFFEKPKYLGNGVSEGLRMQPVTVFVLPHSAVEVKGSFEKYTITGNKFYEEYNLFQESIAELEGKKLALREEYMNLRKNEEVQNKQAKLDSVFAILKDVDVERNAAIEKYVAAHLDSDVSLYLLYTNRGTFGEKYIHQFTDAVKNGQLKKYYGELDTYYERMIAKREAAEKIQEGKPTPDFTLKDINGNDFTLSSLKGKYVVLDFWGSWCGWCIKGIPDMKNIYEKYQGKLEIVGVDCNDTEEKWKAAVEKHEINWINVINGKEKGQDLTTAYNINGFPTKIILSPEGTILKIVVGESPEFYDAIKKLVK